MTKDEMQRFLDFASAQGMDEMRAMRALLGVIGVRYSEAAKILPWMGVPMETKDTENPEE